MGTEERKQVRCGLKRLLGSNCSNFSFFENGEKLILDRLEVHRTFLLEKLEEESWYRASADCSVSILIGDTIEKDLKCDMELVIRVENNSVVSIKDNRINVHMDDHEVFQLIEVYDYDGYRANGRYKNVGSALINRGMGDEEKQLYFLVADKKVRLRDSEGIHEDFATFLRSIGRNWENIEIKYSNNI